MPKGEQDTQHAWVPVPDPSIRTTEQLLRLARVERDFVEAKLEVVAERFRGIDTATKLLDETVNRVPTDIQQAVAHLQSVMDERFKSISLQFEERDTRSERESRDNKVAVDAAFAAQKEAAAQAEVSNAKAIDKSEAATTETIAKLSELFQSSAAGLTDKIDDVKARLTTVESIALGSRQAVGDRHQSNTNTTQILSVVIAALILLVAIAVATHGFK